MKRARAVKIPNLLIWLIFNQHKMLRNCLEEDVCLYCPNARWGGEFEWLKTLHLYLVILQTLLSKAITITIGEYIKRLILKRQTGDHSSRTTAGELQKIAESRGQKTFFFLNVQTAPTSPQVVWEGFEKNYPSSSKNMCTMKYTAVFFYVVGLYFCRRSWTSCLDTWHHRFYQILTLSEFL